MKGLLRLPVFAIFLLLTGCYTAGLLELDGLKPAEVTIRPAVKSLVVVSRCDLDSTFKTSLYESGNNNVFLRDSLLSKQVVLGCSDALLESPRFGLFNPIIHRSLISEYSFNVPKIPWSKAREIAGDPPTDAVLSLEMASINDTLKKSYQDGWMIDQYLVFVKTFWRMYNLGDFQTTDFSFVDTISFDIESPGEFVASPSARLKCIEDAMYASGSMAARRFAPWWTTFDRYYFPLGPVGFSKGAGYLEKAEVTKAAEVWRPFTDARQKKTAAKACFNMALTCEMANNIPVALEWLQKSAKLGIPAYYYNGYRSILTKRLAETQKLNEQLK